MKKLLMAVVLVAAASSAYATAVTCTSLSGGKLDALISATNGTSGGTANTCTADDKIYSNFNYSGGPASSTVDVSFTFNTTTKNFTWSFAGVFSSNFTLGYTVAVDTSICSSCRIDFALEQMFPGTQINGGGTQQISINEGGLGPVVITDAVTTSPSTLSGGIPLPGLTSLTKLATATNLGANSQIAEFDSGIHQTAIPEPMTLSLMGVGLLGLGLLRKRIR